MSKTKIAAAVSGGIDSLVAAFILKKKYDVTGIHFFTGYESRKKSHIKSEIEKMCKHIDIPVFFVDITNEFNEKVVSYFKNSYLRGYTPNPCLICNPFIKFSLIPKKAEELGIDKIATGHYVRTIKDNTGNIYISKGMDESKDQSYFLSMVKPDDLKKAVFPLGTLKKSQVRKIADNFGLYPVEKKESQDICFIKNKDYKDFLKKDKSFTFKKGDIKDITGKKIGTHNGVFNFTIGQRKGINCPGPYPYYVTEIIPEKNLVITGSKEDLCSDYLFAKDLNWFKSPEFPVYAKVKIRYSHTPQKAFIEKPDNKNRVKIIFSSPVKSVAPGQGAVFYDDEDKIIGAGYISKENEKI
ncbi:MAG: tRNA 2-thiouridine(34) synthase MnmA [Thermodesulfobacteriota bacterium]